MDLDPNQREKLDPDPCESKKVDPDPPQIEKIDPDTHPHHSEKKKPYPHQYDVDPQHWLQQSSRIPPYCTDTFLCLVANSLELVFFYHCPEILRGLPKIIIDAFYANGKRLIFYLQVVGVRSGGEVARCKQVYCDPSYAR